MAGKVEKPELLGGRIWNLAPKSITDWGYAVLVLLSVVSVVTGLVKSGSLISVIITVVVVFGLFVALWAFDRMTKSRDGFWVWTGKIAGGAVLAAMVATFISILTYITIGQPAWMDAWFRPGIVIDGPTRVNVRVGSLRVETPMRAKAITRSHWFVSPAMADDLVEHDPRFTATVTWLPDMPPGTVIEISIKSRAEKGAFPPPIKKLDAGVGSATITGLAEGTTYDLQVVAERNGRRSKPNPLQVTTDAEHHAVPMFVGFVALYTGAMDQEGKPNASSGQVLLTPQEERSSTSRWLYEGGFAGGVPDGRGTLTTDPLDCRESVCGSKCTGTFKRGSIVSANCFLTLIGFQGRRNGSRSAIIYAGASMYEGQIVGAGSDALQVLPKDDWPNPTAQLGPFAIWLDGTGHLRATDPVEDYDGSWILGRLDKGSRIGDKGGVLVSGQEYNRADCLLSLTPVKGEGIGGFGGRATCTSIEFGEWRGGGEPFRGFSIDRGDFLSIDWFEGGKRRSLPLSAYNAVSDVYNPYLDYGLLSLPDEPSASPWQLSCDADASPFACTLQARLADITITGTRPLNEIPVFAILTSANVRGGTTTLSIDKTHFVIPAAAKQFSPINYALLAQMCGGHTLRNEEQQQDTSLDGFCPRLGLMFARLYSFGLLRGALGNGPDGRPLHDPNAALFEPGNIVTPVFTDGGRVLEFRPVRFNEGFYTKSDVIGRLVLEISTGDNCTKAFRQEFPVDQLSWFRSGMGRLPISDSVSTWSPSLFAHDLKGVVEYFQSYQQLLYRNEFHRSPQNCYRASGRLEMIYHFKFAFRGALGTESFRLTFPTSGLPTEKDLEAVKEAEFDALNAAYEQHRAEKHMTTIFPQEIGMAFSRAGLDVDWRALSR